MAHFTFSTPVGFSERVGLEGPFYYPSGLTLYYDTAAGQYINGSTDIYLTYDEYVALTTFKWPENTTVRANR